MNIRHIKKQLDILLSSSDSIEEIMNEIFIYPHRSVVNPLFSFFYSGNEHLKWRSISVIGRVVSSLAHKDMEGARVIMRRLMWNLNDESGGIGWGSPEAMGEIMARNERIAVEFSSILISYINPIGNFLEHEGLQQGALWGFERVAKTRPDLATDGSLLLDFYLSSNKNILRGLAIRAAGPIINKPLKKRIESFLDDSSPITYYEEERFITKSIGELSKEALSQPLK